MSDDERPSEAMQALERLLGTWAVTGGAEGTVRFERMEGGHFVLQHVQLTHGGREIRGIEVIGHLCPFGGTRSEDVRSRFYDSAGHTFDYTWELAGDRLTIWGGERGSPARYEGRLDADGRRCAGRWHFPGGGYDSTMTRIP